MSASSKTPGEHMIVIDWRMFQGQLELYVVCPLDSWECTILAGYHEEAWNTLGWREYLGVCMQVLCLHCVRECFYPRGVMHALVPSTAHIIHSSVQHRENPSLPPRWDFPAEKVRGDVLSTRTKQVFNKWRQFSCLEGEFLPGKIKREHRNEKVNFSTDVERQGCVYTYLSTKSPSCSKAGPLCTCTGVPYTSQYHFPQQGCLCSLSIECR